MLANLNNLLRQIAKATSCFDADVYLVGGAVRDLMIGQEPNDLDLLLSDSLVEVVESVASEFSAECKIFPEYRTGSIALPVGPTVSAGMKRIDFSSFRSEVYSSPAALPQVSEGTLETDLARRDFTVNALAVQLTSILDLESKVALDRERLSELLIDQHGGRTDLDNKIIKVLHDQSFIDDPTRLFRAARYKTLLAASYDAGTAELIKDVIASDLIGQLEGYRIKSELQRICASRNSSVCLKELYSLGMMQSLGFLELSEDTFADLSAISPDDHNAFVKSMKLLLQNPSIASREALLKRLAIRGQLKQAILSNSLVDGAL